MGLSACAADDQHQVAPDVVGAEEDEVRVPASESISLEGKNDSTKLSHDNIVPGSEWVYIGLSRARRGLDYSVEYTSGTITFTQPVPDKSSIRVDYSYFQKNAVRPFFGGSKPAIAIQPGYATTLPEGMPGKEGPGTATYGINSMMHVGNRSVITGMWYVSAPQDFADPEKRSAVRRTDTPPMNRSTAGRLIVQNADVALGNLRVRLGYQNVGVGFTGFDQVRKLQGSASPTLGTLEKEKGIRRLDVAADLAVSAESDISVAMSRVQDGGAGLDSVILGFAGRGIIVNYGTREVGSGFRRFNDLREADRKQIGAEAGLRRSLLGVRFAGPGGNWNSLSMSRLTGDGGALTTRSADISFGGLRFTANTRTGMGFGRMSALDSQERTSMALAVRRQFDALSKAEAVTAADLNDFNKEAGLDRNNYLAHWTNGRLGAWFSSMNVSAANGDINRTAFDIRGRQFGFQWSRQSISAGFDRISSLQSIERSAFGNETGMTRTSFAGDYRFGNNELRVGASRVTDLGASFLRQSIDFRSPTLSLHAGLRDIDHAFTRIADLADGDRKELARDRGFRRTDLSLRYRPGNWLTVNFLLDNAFNATDGRLRNLNRQEVFYTPAKGPQVRLRSDVRRNVLSDGTLIGSSVQEVVLRQTLDLAGGLNLLVTGSSRSQKEADSEEQSEKTFNVRLESNQSAPLSFILDSVDGLRTGNLKESVRSVGIRSRLMPNLHAVGLVELIDRNDDNASGFFGVLGLDWTINKDLKMTLNLEEVGRGAYAGRRTRQFSLSGLVARRLLFLEDIKVGTGINMIGENGRRIGHDNALRMEAGLWGGRIEFATGEKLESSLGTYTTSRTMSIKSDPDPGKRTHFSYSAQDGVSAKGERLLRNQYAADAALWKNGKLAISIYTGTRGIPGREYELSGSTVNLVHRTSSGAKVSLDYSGSVDGTARKRGRSIGLGISGVLPSKAQYELQFGKAMVDEGGRLDEGNVFRVRYDHKISDDSFISFSARKRVGSTKGESGSDDGDLTARLDLEMVF